MSFEILDVEYMESETAKFQRAYYRRRKPSNPLPPRPPHTHTHTHTFPETSVRVISDSAIVVRVQ